MSHPIKTAAASGLILLALAVTFLWGARSGIRSLEPTKVEVFYSPEARLLSVKVNEGSSRFNGLVRITDQCPSIPGGRNATFEIRGITPNTSTASATFSNGCFISITEWKRP